MSKEEKEVADKYNQVATTYHNLRTKDNPQGWFYNELLEMPVTFELLGDVKGKKILDLGCGTGIYAKILTKRGALVKGFDISPKMIEIAKKENPDLELKVGSANKIPFDEKFDIVLASLMVHYLNDWTKMFEEIRRVLKPNGIFIFSTGNPVSEISEKLKIDGKKYRILGDYFKERKYYGVWKLKDKKVKVGCYHKTYETIINTIIKNNFEIIGYKDAFPIPRAKKLFPQDYALYSKVPFFTVWKIKKQPEKD